MAPPKRNDPSLLLAPYQSGFVTCRQIEKRLISEYNKMVDKVNNSFFMPPVVIATAGAIDAIRKHLQQVFKELKHLYKHETSVLSLLYASVEWLDVEGKLAAISGDVNYHPTDNIYTWHSDAQAAYDKESGRQLAAVNVATDTATAVRQFLVKIAAVNIEFVTGIAKIMTKLVGILAQAASDSMTGIDIPFAIDAIAKGVKDVVTGELDVLVDSMGKQFIAGLSASEDLAGKSRRNRSVLEDGHWPVSVAR